jgi:hypothetical protein
MDPITTTILAALGEIGSEVIKSGVQDAHDSLKAVVCRKWGETSRFSKAISALEEDPSSKAQTAVLEKKVAAVRATDDAEATEAPRQLVEQLKTHGIGGEAVARIQFNMSGVVVQGVAGAENVQIDSMTFGAPSKR